MNHAIIEERTIGQYAWEESDRMKAVIAAVEKDKRGYMVERRGNVISVYFDVASGWSQSIMLRSDTHWDSVYCRRDLVRKHLDMALKQKALILDGGDFFDAMQGRYDPRRSYAEIRPEHLKDGKYYDNILDDAEGGLAPYAKQILMLAKGNHETAVIKNASMDLTERLADRLNNKHGGQVQVGNYGGWVRLVFIRSHHFFSIFKLKYFHGAGGAAPVTKGTIQSSRQQGVQPDADMIWNGHNHNQYTLPVKRERLDRAGNQYFDLLWHVRTPSYKDEYGDGSGGWAVEGGGEPKPYGAVFVDLSYFSHAIEVRPRAELE